MKKCKECRKKKKNFKNHCFECDNSEYCDSCISQNTHTHGSLKSIIKQDKQVRLTEPSASPPNMYRMKLIYSCHCEESEKEKVCRECCLTKFLFLNTEEEIEEKIKYCKKKNCNMEKDEIDKMVEEEFRHYNKRYLERLDERFEERGDYFIFCLLCDSVFCGGCFSEHYEMHIEKRCDIQQLLSYAFFMTAGTKINGQEVIPIDKVASIKYFKMADSFLFIGREKLSKINNPIEECYRLRFPPHLRDNLKGDEDTFPGDGFASILSMMYYELGTKEYKKEAIRYFEICLDIRNRKIVQNMSQFQDGGIMSDPVMYYCYLDCLYSNELYERVAKIGPTVYTSFMKLKGPRASFFPQFRQIELLLWISYSCGTYRKFYRCLKFSRILVSLCREKMRENKINLDEHYKQMVVIGEIKGLLFAGRALIELQECSKATEILSQALAKLSKIDFLDQRGANYPLLRGDIEDELQAIGEKLAGMKEFRKSPEFIELKKEKEYHKNNGHSRIYDVVFGSVGKEALGNEKLMRKQLLELKTQIEYFQMKEKKKRKRVCGGCKMKESIEVKFKVCSGCKRKYYCSRKCQAGDWKIHKKICTYKFFDVE